MAPDLRLQDVTVLAVGISANTKTQLEEIVFYPPQQTISMLRSYADLDNYSKKFLKSSRMKYGPKSRLCAEQMELDKTGMFKKYLSYYKSNRSSCQGWEQGQAQGLYCNWVKEFGGYENILKLDFGDGFTLYIFNLMTFL